MPARILVLMMVAALVALAACGGDNLTFPGHVPTETPVPTVTPIPTETPTP